MSLTTVYTCTVAQQVGTHKLAFNSVRYDFEDGSVMTTCIVNDPFASYSTTFLYRADQPGAALGSCLVVYELDTGSEGYFQFSTLASGTGTAKYVDPASPLNGTGVTMKCTKR